MAEKDRPGALRLPMSPVGQNKRAGSTEQWLAKQSSKVPRASEGPPPATISTSPTKSHKKMPAPPTNGTTDSQMDSLFRGSGREKLYEAYNDLHALAQVFSKPFDAPAILVVGHQTDGKSALVEALMGFQFNHVGGGTKTRRPISLHMKYNAACVQPHCFLVNDAGHDQEMTLEELQEFIESENQRLQSENQFWNKEIVVKIEYKYSPNLTIIDTPGLISAAPGKKSSNLHVAAGQVEAMVRQKMKQPEYIIMCLEDTSDWSNATTRKLVMEVDPTLARTVLVSTKFDTRLPQFSSASDVEAFLHPHPSLMMNVRMLGGSPFFTSVPSGRVGNAKDAIFRSNEHFREAVHIREGEDVAVLHDKMKRSLDKSEKSHLGISQLRRFLEQLLQRRYLVSVPTIVPLLEKEYRNADQRLKTVTEELTDLNNSNLKDKGRAFVESFISKLSMLMKGTTSAPAERFGETLQDEHLRGGAFTSANAGEQPAPFLPAEEPTNAKMRLYGGAQYNRAMAEFRGVVGAARCPDIDREEIVNACGVDDFHDGANVIRTACVIGMAKAREIFEPFLNQLGYRLAHILRRMLPISMYLQQKDGQFLTGHDMFLKRVGAAFHEFIDLTEKDVRNKCKEDLLSTTRYVTWSLHTKNGFGLRSMLGNVSMPSDGTLAGVLVPKPPGPGGPRQSVQSAAIIANPVSDVLDGTLWNRDLGKMSEEIVATLVCQLFEGIRDYLVQAAEMKFNCFFLMPVIDSFPMKLREELEAAYDEDLDEVFDVGSVRKGMEQKKKDLENEKHQVEKLQRKFAAIHTTLVSQSGASSQ